MLAESAAFTTWLDRFFDSYYKHRPVNGTFIGVHDGDHRLPDLSDNGAGDALADAESLLRESLELPAEPLAAAERIDLQLAQGFLRTQIWEMQSGYLHRDNPSFYTGEAIFGIMSLFLTNFAPVAERAAAAIERMEGVPALLSQGRSNVRRAPQAWTERAIRECAGADAFLTAGLQHVIADEHADSPGLETSAAIAAAAFAEFRSYLESELLAASVDRHCCGKEAFAMYLREGHCVDESAATIATIAEHELSEAAARLSEQARDFGANNSAEALGELRSLHPPPDRYDARHQEVSDAMREVTEKQALLTWPEFPLRFVPQPRWARDAAPHLYFLVYRSPAATGRPRVHDVLVPALDASAPADQQRAFLETTNDSVIKLNHVIHHGGVGHHVQNWHAFRAASRIGRVAAVDCAARIAMFCGGTMAEGWACYATGLMSEAGALTPLEQYSEHQSRMRMCARAVVDIRLHSGQFSLRQATDYYERAALMAPAAAMAGAVQNSMFPGTAAMYMLGTDAIHKLRGELSARDGRDFDLRKFHDELLSYGSIPVSLIAAEMMARRGDGE